MGVDDAIVEGISAGAVGWIAGLVNAFPKESVDLFNYAMNGETEKARELYEWFLPLLRLDTVPKFVQLIKLVQEKVGMGTARVRPPRLELAGAELEETIAIIDTALATRAAVAGRPRVSKGVRLDMELLGTSIIGFARGDATGKTFGTLTRAPVSKSSLIFIPRRWMTWTVRRSSLTPPVFVSPILPVASVQNSFASLRTTSRH